jgi:hypothetical protein
MVEFWKSLSEATRATHEAEKMLLGVLRCAVPEGTVFDIRDPADDTIDEALSRLKSVRGSTKGMNIFKVTSVTEVVIDPMNPDAATWTIETAPINAKNHDENEMVGGSKKRPHKVILTGTLATALTDDKPGDALRRILDDALARSCAIEAPHP